MTMTGNVGTIATGATKGREIDRDRLPAARVAVHKAQGTTQEIAAPEVALLQEVVRAVQWEERAAQHRAQDLLQEVLDHRPPEAHPHRRHEAAQM